MSRVHDMGGRFGDGPVDPADNATFAQEWHARALALTLAAGGLGQWNIDTSRHAREGLAAQDYARFSYYEKWLAALADLLVAKGIVTRDELANGAADGVSELAAKHLAPADVAAALARGGPADRPGPAPKFQVGARVRTLNPARNRFVAGGHTRLPGYAAGMRGTIVMVHGVHVLPDSNAHGLGEAPEPLYGVAFSGETLWGQGSDEVVVDLWQSYLEPS